MWAAKMEVSMVRRLQVGGVLSIFIVFGLFLANYSAVKAYDYWCAMFPAFGLVCLGHQLIAGNTGGMPMWKVVLKQIVHWLGPIIAVSVVFLQLTKGEMDSATVALTILLILSVTCFLAGLHFDPVFILLSIVLMLVALLGAEIEAYIWLTVFIGLLAATVAIFATVLLRRQRKPVPNPT
jgi:hypothetical protein